MNTHNEEDLTIEEKRKQVLLEEKIHWVSAINSSIKSTLNRRARFHDAELRTVLFLDDLLKITDMFKGFMTAMVTLDDLPVELRTDVVRTTNLFTDEVSHVMDYVVSIGSFSSEKPAGAAVVNDVQRRCSEAASGSSNGHRSERSSRKAKRSEYGDESDESD